MSHSYYTESDDLYAKVLRKKLPSPKTVQCEEVYQAVDELGIWIFYLFI